MVLLPPGVAALLRAVGPQERGTPQSPLHGALVHDQRIFDVVSVVGQNGDAEVLAGGPVVVADELHRLRLHHRHLWIVHKVAPRVGPYAVVGSRYAQRLLGHSGAHGDTGRGVVLRVGDHSGRHAQDDHRVQLHVGVLLGDPVGNGELSSAPLAFQYLVGVAAGVHPVGVHRREGVVAVLAPSGDLVRVHKDQ